MPGEEPPQSPVTATPRSLIPPCSSIPESPHSVVYVREISVDKYLLDGEEPVVCFTGSYGTYTVFRGEIRADGYTIRWETHDRLAQLIAASADYLRHRSAGEERKELEALHIIRGRPKADVRLAARDLDEALQDPEAFLRERQVVYFEALRLMAEGGDAVCIQLKDSDEPHQEFEAELRCCTEQLSLVARLMETTHRATFVRSSALVAALHHAISNFQTTYFDYFPSPAA